MPLPKASRSASKKKKRSVMSKCMRKLSDERPEMEQDQKVAICLERSGQSRKKKLRRRKKK